MLFARCAVGQLDRGGDPRIILKVGPVIKSGRPGYGGRSQSFWFWGKHGPSFDIGEPERFAVTCRTGRYMYSTQDTSALDTKAE